MENKIKPKIIYLCLILFSLFNPNVSANVDIVYSLIEQGSEYQKKGFYRDANTLYEKAYRSVTQMENPETFAISQAALGYSEYLLNHLDKAEPLLSAALEFATSTKNVGLQAMTEYYSGLLNLTRNQRHKAQQLLRQSYDHAEVVNDPIFSSKVLLALAESETDPDSVKNIHDQILQKLDQVEAQELTGEIYLLLVEQGLNHEIFPKLINTSQTKSNPSLTPVEKKQIQGHLAYLYHLLQKAQHRLDPSDAIQKARLNALKANLYESQDRFTEALQLNQIAISLLHDVYAKDRLVFYEWQAGRLYKALNNYSLALDSYHRAISYIQDIRQDIPVRYNNGKSSFYELFGPLYRGMIELLLDNAKKTDDTAVKNDQLKEVQMLLEKLKQNELEDFFKDRCLLNDINAQIQTKKQQNLAIYYPIVLPERIEVLLNVGDDFYQHVVPVNGKNFEQIVRRYAGNLREGGNIESGRQLYEWLIRPIESELNQHQVDTLVYLPDGALRLLPISSLYDGEKYLIEKYSISTLPSLAMLPPQQQSSIEATKTLLVGLSEPSIDTVAQLPDSLLGRLFEESIGPQMERSLAFTSTLRSTAVKLRQANIAAQERTREVKLKEIAEALALPGVKEEIELLSENLESKTIINQEYTLNYFDQLAEQPIYDTIHIASHGFFGGTSDESFIMSYDKLLTIDHLEELLMQRSNQQPIDLLVLSACQTAEGDDRAPLGISGIALKAKAKTALGSLWPISDEAAVLLMKNFYKFHKEKGIGKAKALQKAQIELIRTKNLNHPFYWSPFVLVGHWQ